MKHLLLTTIAAVVLVGCGMADRALIQAARTGNHEAVKQHLASGADVNATDMIGRTPLHYAATKEITELLIANGTDVNAKDDDLEFTPLHLAAEYGHKEIAELLIDNNADVSAKDQHRTTPLHYVVAGGHKKAAELLIGKGADVNTKDAAGMTPLDFAIIYNHPETANILRKHGGKTGKELKAEEK